MNDLTRVIKLRPNLKVLVVNALEESYDPDQVQGVIEAQADIDGWWNHFPGVWLIDTKLSAYELAKIFYTRFEGISCFVSNIETGKFSGRMSGSAWLWLLDKSEEEKDALRKRMIKRAGQAAQKKIGKS